MKQIKLMGLVVPFWLGLSQAEEIKTVPDPQSSCGLNQTAQTLANLVINDPSQKRQQLVCDAELTQIAQQRSTWLLENHASDITPNAFLVDAGYRMPEFYPLFGNQVEAYIKGQADPQTAMKELKNSGKHHDHVLGVGEFFSRQDRIGVGVSTGLDGALHWVVLISESIKPLQVKFKQEFNFPYVIQKDCEKDWQKSNNPYLVEKCRSLGTRPEKHKRKTKKD